MPKIQPSNPQHAVIFSKKQTTKIHDLARGHDLASRSKTASQFNFLLEVQGRRSVNSAELWLLWTEPSESCGVRRWVVTTHSWNTKGHLLPERSLLLFMLTVYAKEDGDDG